MSILNEQDVINFYNSFANRQVRVGQNERHHSIFKYLLQKGLKKNHQILEIGCGIGTLTGLISKYLKHSGHITAIDISDENIRIAKKKYGSSKNIEWICSNILVFNSSNKFDFIVLPDVLEHIPFIQYENLFVKLKFFLKESGIIFIHIPNPFYNEWIKINHPDQLQIIDQSVYLETIFGHIIQNNFYIHYLNNFK